MSLGNIKTESYTTPLVTVTTTPKSSPATPMIDSPEAKMQIAATPANSLYNRVTNYLDDLDVKLDAVPNNQFQEKMDAIGASIQKQFSKLDGFNTWLDDNGQGEWYKQLATFLYKLPIRAVRNIVRLLYLAIKEMFTFLIHPLKSLNKLARLLVNLAVELTKPETWAKIGTGVIGASLGQAAVGCPLSIVGMGLGAAMLISGLSFTAIKSAVKAEEGDKWNQAKKALLNVGKELPEVMVTGFLMGLLIGAIRKTVVEQKQNIIPEKRTEIVQSGNLEQQTIDWGRDFVQREGLPKPDLIRFIPKTKEVMLAWKYNPVTEHTILKTHTWWGFNYFREGGQTYSFAGITPEPVIAVSTVTKVVITPAQIVNVTASTSVPVVGSGGPLLGSAAVIKA